MLRALLAFRFAVSMGTNSLILEGDSLSHYQCTQSAGLN